MKLPLSGKVCSGISGILYAGMSCFFSPEKIQDGKVLHEMPGKLCSGITGKV